MVYFYPFFLEINLESIMKWSACFTWKELFVRSICNVACPNKQANLQGLLLVKMQWSNQDGRLGFGQCYCALITHYVLKSVCRVLIFVFVVFSSLWRCSGADKGVQWSDHQPWLALRIPFSHQLQLEHQSQPWRDHHHQVTPHHNTAIFAIPWSKAVQE